MAHPRWREGRLSTGFIAEEFPDGFHPQPPDGPAARVLAAVAAVLDDIDNARKREISGQMLGPPVRFARRRHVMLGSAEYVVEVQRRNGDATVSFISPETAALSLQSSWRPGELVWQGTIDGTPAVVQVRSGTNGFELLRQGVAVTARVYTKQEAAAARLMPAKAVVDAGKAVRCPMPGLIVSIAVAEGQQVRAGETLAVIEAMKMENVLRAEHDGLVKTVHAKPGDSLAVDAVILEFA
jgi:propionyl-CoA carboxylase alpha chain